jgi:hypothetical protein
MLRGDVSSLMRSGILVLAAALVVAAPAQAGGDFVDLSVHGTRVWFVGEFGVRELDARSGRVVASPRLANASYPLSVAVAGGAAWVASVENGFVAGKLSRIDLASGRIRTVFRQEDGSVQYVASARGGVYALIGRPGGNEIARFDADGRLVRRWRIADAGRMAADGSGCWISGSNRLVHIDAGGRVHVVLHARLGDVATGNGAAWLALAGAILRVDERTGRVTTMRTATLRLGGFQHDIAVGRNNLWTLQHATSSRRSTLVRRSLITGHITGVVAVPGIADAVALTPTSVWVGVVRAPIGRPATGYTVLRLDPRTLKRTLGVPVS